MVHNSLYRNYYLPESLRDGGLSRTPEPAFTLDPTFKVKLFWVTSRANACRYCLGHQEFKLRVARVTDDEIAALEGDPAKLEAKLAAAVRYTLQLTRQPHAIPPSMWEELNQHFTPAQQAELTLTIAGYNATNRRTGALNLPGEAHGEFFRPDSTPMAGEAATVESSRFRTVTSATCREQKSRIVSQRPQPRPALG